MQTCSNCGASNREGAKFCTTCGTRLNSVVASSGSTGWGALDDDATRVETPAVTATTTEEPTTTEAPAWPQEPVATAWSWNQTRTSEELAVPVTSTDEPTTTPPTSSSWASQWTSVEADDFGDDEPVTSTTTTGAPTWDSPEPVVAGATTTTEAPSWTTTPAAPEPDVVDNTTPVDDVIAVEPTIDIPEAPTSADTAPITTEAPAGARARAQELIAELQSLIDAGVAEPAVDTDGDTASALAALAAIGDDDANRFDGLRETVEKARTQPRDLDTMLGLIGQADAIADLLDAYETQRTAIAEAKATLQG